MNFLFFARNAFRWDWVGKLIDQLRDRLAPRPILRPIPIPVKNDAARLPHR
jgi:hypothetical protein